MGHSRFDWRASRLISGKNLRHPNAWSSHKASTCKDRDAGVKLQTWVLRFHPVVYCGGRNLQQLVQKYLTPESVGKFLARIIPVSETPTSRRCGLRCRAFGQRVRSSVPRDRLLSLG